MVKHLYKFVPILIFVLLCTISVSAQTTVNLTVTDTPDNQTWNNGTWSVQLQPASGNLSGTRTFTLISGGGSLSNQSGSLSSTGTASISLPANANIGPVTVWQFPVCPQASANCFQQSVTVSTSSPQALSITPASIRINMASATPPISAYTTGEIQGAALGSQFYLIGTGEQFCTAVSGNNCSTWASNSGGAARSIDVSTGYGTLAYGKICFDATLTASSSVITSAGQCNWSQADVGSIVFATSVCTATLCGFANYPTSISIFPSTQNKVARIASVQSATQITTDCNSPGNCVAATPNGTGNAGHVTVFWAQDGTGTSTATLNAAFTAGYTTQGQCPHLDFPVGLIPLQAAVFSTVPATNSNGCN